jgi:hypothetical protein
MKIDDCPKWLNCSAPICPVDEQYISRVHIAGEKICFYLNEYAKPHARANLKGCIAEEHYQAIAEAYPKIIDRYVPISKALQRAANTPSRLGKKPGGGS